MGGKAAEPGLGALPNFTAVRLDGSVVDASELAGVPGPVGMTRYIPSAASEPTIGVNKKGAVVMGGVTGASSSVWITTNQGATWKDISPKLPSGQQSPPVTLDPFIHVDPDTGRIFNADLYVACHYLSWSDNDGDSWISNPFGCGHPMGLQDHQSIYTGKPRSTPTVGYANMVYYCVNRIGDTSCAASNNGGIAFGPLLPVFLGVDVERGGLCGGLNAHVKTDREGRVFVPKAQCAVPSVGVSEDDGRTWKTYKISSQATLNGDHEVALASDDANNLYALWIGDTGLAYFSMSKDHGKTWSAAKVVSPPGVTMTDKPAIAASAAGKVAFAYIGSTSKGGYKNRQASDWTEVSWNAYIGVVTDALDPNPIVLTTTANPIEDPMAVHECGGTRCIPLYDFIDVEIDSAGRPWGAFVDLCIDECPANFKKDPGSVRNHRDGKGFAGTLSEGPALTKEGGALPSLPAVAPASAPSKA